MLFRRLIYRFRSNRLLASRLFTHFLRILCFQFFFLLINNHSIAINFVKSPSWLCWHQEKYYIILDETIPSMFYIFKADISDKSDFGGRNCQLGPDKIKGDTVCILYMLWKNPPEKRCFSRDDWRGLESLKQQWEGGNKCRQFVSHP